MEATAVIILSLLLGGLFLFLLFYIFGLFEKKGRIILAQWGLTFSDLIYCQYCRYIGGHPEQDREVKVASFAAKNGKLLFFGGVFGYRYLFDIPIDSIGDIQQRGGTVVIFWSDDRFNHPTELRFTGGGANARALSAKTALMKIAR